MQVHEKEQCSAPGNHSRTAFFNLPPSPQQKEKREREQRIRCGRFLWAGPGNDNHYFNHMSFSDLEHTWPLLTARGGWPCGSSGLGEHLASFGHAK